MKFLRPVFKAIRNAAHSVKNFIEPKPRTGLRNPDFELRAKTAEDIVGQVVFPHFPRHAFKNFLLAEDVGYAGVEIHHETVGHVANIHFFGNDPPIVEYTRDSVKIGEAIAQAFHKSAGFRTGWKSAAFLQKKKLLPVAETNLA